MIKVRLQGTKRDIRWLLKVLGRDKRFSLQNTSDFFCNKGTDKYRRLYTEIVRKDKSDKGTAEKRDSRREQIRGIYCGSGTVFRNVNPDKEI